MSIRLFILAGETSADIVGAAAVGALQQAHEVALSGVGGPRLISAGLRTMFPMEALSVMGFSDVAMRLPALLWRVRQVANAIERQKPDVALLIDSQVFSAMVARRLRARNYAGPILLYVAPSVWAWNPDRAAGLKGVFDEILAVLPFEPRIMGELGGPPTSYVGHPALQQTAGTRDNAGVPDKTIGLLPGSRRGELKRHLAIFGKVAGEVAQRDPGVQFVLPTLPGLAPAISRAVAGWSVPVNVVSESGLREKAFDEMQAALACAGTVSLELALRGVPFVGTYVPDYWQLQAYKKAGRPKILLPNVLLETGLVPEVAPGPGYVGRLVEQLLAALSDADVREAQRIGFHRMRELMVHGEPKFPRVAPADRILAHVKGLEADASVVS